jgi:AcrR family transcriptional regulator
MRNLARELSVTPGTIYAYVTSKDEIVSAVLDRLAEEIEVSSGDPRISWHAELRQLLSAYYKLLTQHPELLAPSIVIRGAMPSGARLAERLLFLLERGGFDGELGIRQTRMLTAYVVGAAANATWMQNIVSQGAIDATLYNRDEFPRVHRLTASVDEHNAHEVFDEGLDFIIGALRQPARPRKKSLGASAAPQIGRRRTRKPSR